MSSGTALTRVNKDPEKQEKIQQIALLLKGALRGDKLVGIKMNVSEAKLEEIVGLLPSLHAPTVAPLYQSDWFSVETVVDTSVVRDLIPQLLNVLATIRHRDLPQRVFELGTVVIDGTNRKSLACVVIHRRANYTEMKSLAEAINGSMKLQPSKRGLYIPGRGAEFPGGSFGELHPGILKHFRLDNPVTVLELEL